MFKKSSFRASSPTTENASPNLGIVIRAEILHMVIRPFCWEMWHANARQATSNAVWPQTPPTASANHLHRVLFVEVDVELLDLPRLAVRHLFLIARVRRERSRLRRVRRRPVRAVAVFAVHILRDHDVRPARAVDIRHKAIDASRLHPSARTFP